MLHGNNVASLPSSLTGFWGIPKSGLAHSLEMLTIYDKSPADVQYNNQNLRVSFYQNSVANIPHHTYEEYKKPAIAVAAIGVAAGVYYVYKRYQSYAARVAAEQADQEQKDLLKKQKLSAQRKRAQEIEAVVEELIKANS